MKFPFHYGKQQTNQCSSAWKILPVKSPAMQTQIHSSNINEVIRAVSNVLLFFFFLRKDFVHTKSTKQYEKYKNAQKA